MIYKTYVRNDPKLKVKIKHTLYTVIGSVVLFFIFYRIFLVFYPVPDIGGSENNVIYFIQRILNRQAIYSDPEQVPYSIAQYSPAYYYLVAFVSKLASIDADQVEKIFIVNRLVSLFLNFALIALAIHILKTIFNLKTSYCIISGFLIFIFTEGNYCRPDSLSSFCWVVSVYFFLVFLKKSPQKNFRIELVAASLSGVVALLAKQSAVTILVITFLFLLKENNLRGAITYFLWSFLFIIVILVFALYWWDIHSLYKNIISGLNNGIAFGKYWEKFVLNFYARQGFLFLAGFYVIIYHTLWKRGQSKYFQFIGFASILEFLFSNLTAIKYGSGPNYFIQWIVLVFLGVTVLADKIKNTLNDIAPQLAFMLLSLVTVLRLTAVIHPLITKLKHGNYKSAKELLVNEKRIAQFIRAQPEMRDSGLVFNNLFSPESYLNNFLFREAIIPQYDIVYGCTYPRNVFNYADLKGKISQGKIKFMVMNNQILQPKFYDVDLHQFKLLARISNYNIYKWSP